MTSASNPKIYIIFSPSYNENSGGAVCLHKLCHLINELGGAAFLLPHYNSYIINKTNLVDTLLRLTYNHLQSLGFLYRLNKKWNTNKITLKEFQNLDKNNVIVIYPEITLGNPLNAKNVIRWLLHNPGFHTQKILYGSGEIYFRFNSAVKEFTHLGSNCSSNFLKIVSYPIDLYRNKANLNYKRNGVAYCIRKGLGKAIVHDIKNSILIDNKSHNEIAEIFSFCHTFISYDTYTAYSLLAAISGCISVVVPDPGVSIEDWYPNPKDRLGIAYGFSDEQIIHAKTTQAMVLDRLRKEEHKSVQDTENFLKESSTFFYNNEKNSI